MSATPEKFDFPPEIKTYKAIRLMSEPAKQTLTAILKAAAEQHLDLTNHSTTRSLVISVGNYNPQLDTDANSEPHYHHLRRNTNPLWLLKVLPNMPASHFAILTKSGGPNHSVATHEQATKLARDLLISGEADTVLCADLPTATAQILTATQPK